MTSPLAVALNETVQKENPVALSLLSRRGREIFFPVHGILGQTAEAKGKKYDATIGIALEEDGGPMCLPSLTKSFALPAKKVVTYASSFGDMQLRTIWKERMRRNTPSLRVDTSLPVVTAGLTHALDCAGALFIDPGDEVVITDKFWDNYRLTFENNHGGTLMPFHTFSESEFSISALLEAIKSTKARKKIVLLNFPNNPCGYTPTEDEAEGIAQGILARAEAGDELVIIVDDAYYGLVYEEGITKESLFGRLAGLHENVLAVKIDGVSKEEYAWGLRIGFLTFGMKGLGTEGLRALEHKAAGVVRSSISNACQHSQNALLELYTSATYEQEKRQKFEVLQERYREVRRVLAAHPEFDENFTPYPFNSGYFLCVQLTKNTDADAVRKRLLSDFDTGVIAIGSMIRIAYSALPTRDIEAVFVNLHAACKAH
jgi:aspartate/methionine/tyrosine aminotransferase